ncbi:hypothetical protein N7535_003706 [Penicillium sp. DV-2018c]|nr:hypothetical protein N7461_000592 [Penicillium sp. DV-2018c]KAJ5576780.1 hypothetical protein N7535_003706 [Penicillium sp. DV-2018c]
MKLPNQPVCVIIPSPAPSIESSRLLLRPIISTDAPALFAIRSRPEVAEMNDPNTPFKSIEETREWMATKVFTSGPAEVLGRSFYYAILDKSISALRAEDQLVGYASVNRVDPFPEFGYALHPDAWGRGIATEALGLMLKLWWGLERRCLGGDSESAEEKEKEKAFALCHKRNVGSCRVLEKCGFKNIGDFVYIDIELFVFALERP